MSNFWDSLQAVLNKEIDKHFRIPNMYKNKEATDKMTYILERFVNLADRYHFKPVLFVIPEKSSMFKGTKSKDYLNQLKQDKKFSKMKIIIINDFKFDYEKFYILPYKGHASEYGNRVIADILYKNLKDKIKKISIYNERK